ncbi:MAG TPA: flagellin [Candidatus Flavonifractor merdavium]|nr:flagellin [Candidatus Flavonifractor merdavium]
MRIQHNIMAMNAYRNYNNNTSALSKNLEKLSSGYKINRAGDDAAGLAISEKMRAQITGLEGAQKNAKDGISLVQTAEGALTEVHDMLNRMYSLAEQSANGTYENETDRAQLQKEVVQLKTEIDRIADSANFNGIKLLDGSLSEAGAAGTTGSIEADLSKLGLDITLGAENIDAVKGVYEVNDLLGATSATGLTDGDKFEFSMTFVDANGKEQTINKTITVKQDGTTGKWNFYLDDGSEEGLKLDQTISGTGTSNVTVTRDELNKAVKEALEKDKTFKENFEVAIISSGAANNANGLSFTARVPGSAGATVTGIKFTDTKGTTETNHATKIDVTAKPTDAMKGYDLADAKLWDGKSSTLEDSIFEINGKKFAFIASGVTIDDDMLKALNDAGVEHWVQATGATAQAADVTAMVEKIKKETGLDVEQGAVGTGTDAGKWTAGTTGTQIIFKPGTQSTEGASGGLTLQIGDTSDSYNQLTVTIKDCHTKSLGIEELDIGTQKGAAAALQTIENAINYVSDVRGTLGATQNRLDHTINNLSVMQENIQDAESTIRDTDIADEMMSYTKNNILIQSAQAMLAQANQVPQGVLQLLQ